MLTTALVCLTLACICLYVRLRRLDEAVDSERVYRFAYQERVARLEWNASGTPPLLGRVVSLEKEQGVHDLRLNRCDRESRELSKLLAGVAGMGTDDAGRVDALRDELDAVFVQLALLTHALRGSAESSVHAGSRLRLELDNAEVEAAGFKAEGRGHGG